VAYLCGKVEAPDESTIVQMVSVHCVIAPVPSPPSRSNTGEVSSMPAVKKTSASAVRGGSGKPAAMSASTRRQLERAVVRLEKSLSEAGDALQALGRDASTGARVAYRDLGKSLKVLQRDAQKTNRALVKDLEQLGAAVSPAKPPARTPRTAKAPTRAATPAAKTTRSAKAPSRTAKAPAKATGNGAAPTKRSRSRP
jgi:hypothetical protein